MKTLFALTIVLLSIAICKGQTTQQKVDQKIAELKSLRVDTIVCYSIICIGSDLRIETDSCDIDSIKYLIWKSDKQHYIQRFDNCYEYRAKYMPMAFLNTIVNNFKKILNEKILYPEYTEIVNGKKRTFGVYIDHSCHTIFDIHVPSGKVEKDIDDFATDTKLIDGKFPNRNYNKNRRTLLFKLEGIIENIVHEYYPIKKVP